LTLAAQQKNGILYVVIKRAIPAKDNQVQDYEYLTEASDSNDLCGDAAADAQADC
jgi:hypothetical protein